LNRPPIGEQRFAGSFLGKELARRSNDMRQLKS
jgi:hypothetical protein